MKGRYYGKSKDPFVHQLKIIDDILDILKALEAGEERTATFAIASGTLF